MTLIGAILEKVKSNSSLNKKCVSPPPELEKLTMKKKMKRKPVDKFSHIKASVNSSPPHLHVGSCTRHLPAWRARIMSVYTENMRLVQTIRRMHHARGKVDCRWKVYPQQSRHHYTERVDFYRNMEKANRAIYRRILDTRARTVPTAVLTRDWQENRSRIIYNARKAFVLFPPAPRQVVEDALFQPPPGVKRPRVHLTLRIRGGAQLGELCLELFSDVCRDTCRLFLRLLAGDDAGYGYVNTCFFRKVAGLYWCGGDVVHNSGFGRYAQSRRAPIPPENYYFPHSMPGLLSMKVTRDDEVCGIFNITFKPLPQFDLNNVVFGRVVRPSSTFEAMMPLGSPLSSWPVVEVERTRSRRGAGWVAGRSNTRLCCGLRRGP